MSVCVYVCKYVTTETSGNESTRLLVVGTTENKGLIPVVVVIIIFIITVSNSNTTRQDISNTKGSRLI